MIVVVLGMHKSGTTLVAQMLHESGIDMGEFDPDLGYDDDNKFERHKAQEINRSLLDGYLIPPIHSVLRRLGSEQYDQAGYRKNSDSLALVRYAALRRRLTDQAEPRIEELVQNCSRTHADWGFKDPRTALTYPAWQRYLPEHRLIVVYRSYTQLVHRYLKGSNNLPKLFRVLHSWTTYNMAVLEHIESTLYPTIILNYERMMDGDEEYQRLVRFLDRPIKDARDPGLYRHRGQSEYPQKNMEKFLHPFLPAQPQEILSALDAKRSKLI